MKSLKSVFRRALLAGCVAGWSVSAANAATISQGHVDIGVAYEDDAWDLHIHNEETDKEYEAGAAVLRVNAAAQTIVPFSPSFSFLGTAGDPVWILPAAEDPNLLFLGLATEEIPAGTFVGDQVKLTLKGVSGPGHFALYTVGSFGSVSVKMNSRDGFDSSDLITLNAPSHAHANMAFSAAGTYTITFEASAILNDGENTATASGNVDYTFLVIGDTGKPTVAISTPANNARTNSPAVTVAGVAKDDGKVKQVLLDFNGNGFQPMSLASNATVVSWSYESQPRAGTNFVLVKSIDATGKESSAVKRTFFFVVNENLDLSVNGSGTITSFPSTLGTPTHGASLEIGRPYKVQAIPGANYVFSNWTGSVTSTSPVLNFVMESNMVLQANFIPNPFIPASGVYNGLFRHSENVLHENSGFITLKVNTNFSYSGKLLLDGNALSVSGKFALDGTVTRQIDRSKVDKSALTLTLALDFANGTDKIIGTLSSPQWSSSVDADKATFSHTALASAFMGSYTFLLPGFEDAAVGPAGYGYGLVKVSSNGVIKVSGALPDAIATKQSVAISKDGRWPLYVPLYVSSEVINGKTVKFYKGSIIDWVTFSDGSLSGNLKWQKTAWTNGFYDAGFQFINDITGSAYVAPAAGTRALAVTNGTVTFDGGNLLSSFSNDLFFKTNNTLVVSNNVNGVALKVNPKTGLFSGSFTNPVTTAYTKLSGALLQSDNIAGAVFRGTDQTGAVLLQAKEE